MDAVRRTLDLYKSFRGGAYLIFVIFFAQAKFLENKIYTEKRVNYDKIHIKLPFFALLRQNTQKIANFFVFNL